MAATTLFIIMAKQQALGTEAPGFKSRFVIDQVSDAGRVAKPLQPRWCTPCWRGVKSSRVLSPRSSAWHAVLFSSGPFPPEESTATCAEVS